MRSIKQSFAMGAARVSGPDHLAPLCPAHAHHFRFACAELLTCTQFLGSRGEDTCSNALCMESSSDGEKESTVTSSPRRVSGFFPNYGSILIKATAVVDVHSEHAEPFVAGLSVPFFTARLQEPKITRRAM